MSVAVDTNVLVRLLVRDDEAQFALAQRLVDEAAAVEEPVLIDDQKRSVRVRNIVLLQGHHCVQPALFRIRN